MDNITVANKVKKDSSRENIFKNQSVILILIMVCVTVIGYLFVPSMLQKNNLLNVLRLASVVGLTAMGAAVVLIVGEIDLSIGSTLSLSLVAGGLTLKYGIVPTLLVTVLTGVIVGAINGLIVTKLRINSLIVTLGTMSVFGGLAQLISHGQSVFLYKSPIYLWLGRGYIVGIPVPAVILIIVGILLTLMLVKTKLGKEIYFTGANKIAARISGIEVNRIKLIAYIISGLTASLAGPLLSSQTAMITPIQGTGYEMTAIAIAVLGGTSLFGGKGTIIGTILGALTFEILLNILSLTGASTYMEQVLKGFLLIAIVATYQIIQKQTA
jgi:ribose/xylose/arabinose/galactoside ABC-type transport system permease subunit